MINPNTKELVNENQFNLVEFLEEQNDEQAIETENLSALIETQIQQMMEEFKKLMKEQLNSTTSSNFKIIIKDTQRSLGEIINKPNVFNDSFEGRKEGINFALANGLGSIREHGNMGLERALVFGQSMINDSRRYIEDTYGADAAVELIDEPLARFQQDYMDIATDDFISQLDSFRGISTETEYRHESSYQTALSGIEMAVSEKVISQDRGREMTQQLSAQVMDKLMTNEVALDKISDKDLNTVKQNLELSHEFKFKSRGMLKSDFQSLSNAIESSQAESPKTTFEDLSQEDINGLMIDKIANHNGKLNNTEIMKGFTVSSIHDPFLDNNVGCGQEFFKQRDIALAPHIKQA